MLGLSKRSYTSTACLFFREEQKRWKLREDTKARPKDLTIDGDVHPNPGPLFKQQQQQQPREQQYSVQYNYNNIGRWRQKRRKPWLQDAGARRVAAFTRAIPGNRQRQKVTTTHYGSGSGLTIPSTGNSTTFVLSFISPCVSRMLSLTVIFSLACWRLHLDL